VQTLILTLHIIVCVLLVILVLLQSGKEGMGVIFGGGSSSVFGSGGAGGILVKLTAFMAVLFIITSLSYNYVTTEPASEDSIILDVKFEEDAKPSTLDKDKNLVPTALDPKVDAVKKSDIDAKDMNKSDADAKEKAAKSLPVKSEKNEDVNKGKDNTEKQKNEQTK